MIALVNKKREQSMLRSSHLQSQQSQDLDGNNMMIEEDAADSRQFYQEMKSDYIEGMESENQQKSQDNMDRLFPYAPLGCKLKSSPQDRMKSFFNIRFSRDYKELLQQNLSDHICQVQIESPIFFSTHIQLNVKLYPYQGEFSNRRIPISFVVTKDYPFKPVLAFAEEFIYHPNVNNTSKQIYWKILDEREWKPTLTIYFIILQLKFAFIEPDLSFVPNTPECIECAELFQCNKREFKRRFEMFYQSNDTTALENQISQQMTIDHGVSPNNPDLNSAQYNNFQYNLFPQNRLASQISNNHSNQFMNPFENDSKEFNNQQQNNHQFNFQENQHHNFNFSNSSYNNNNNSKNQNINIISSNNNNNLIVPMSNNFQENQLIQPQQLQKDIFKITPNSFEDHVRLVFPKNQRQNNNPQQQQQFLQCPENQIRPLSLNSSPHSSPSSPVEQKSSIEENRCLQNDNQLTPTLKRGRFPKSNDTQNQYNNNISERNNLFEEEEAIHISKESNLVSNSNNNQVGGQQTLKFNSLLDTTSCQMNPKRRQLQNIYSHDVQQLQFTAEILQQSSFV